MEIDINPDFNSLETLLSKNLNQIETSQWVCNAYHSHV